MADLNLQTLNPETGKAPKNRILDAVSLNAVIKKLIELDKGSALSRIDVQKMIDGAPPFDPAYIRDSGQEGRCNLNFGDGKAMLKAEMAGYYDLTDSVPTLGLILTDYGSPNDPARAYWNAVMSEEYHRLLKDWKSFDQNYQQLIQKFCSHGLGFTYYKDDVDFRWEVAGLDEFKLPRGIRMNEDEIDIATVLREVTIGKLYSWIRDVPDSDTRWNKRAVETAIIRSADSGQTVWSSAQWEKWQAILKNNDLFASSTAQDVVRLAHAWIKEFDGQVSHYLTLQDGSNTDYLYKCENRFSCVNECFTFFPYEVSTNGQLHSVRGKAHEIYAAVQVLNTMRCQTVDNAKLAGSLLIQPKTDIEAADMAILFYGGAAYVPPGVNIVNPPLGNPSSGILPVIRDMTQLMRGNSGETAAESADNRGDKTRLEVRANLQKEAKLPTASMNLFYQPWGRNLSESWRRASNKKLIKSDPGADLVLAMRDRIVARGVPEEAIFQAKRIIPMRAIGYGSPSARALAFDGYMQYYGSLDPVGQNNLLRDWFAQGAGYETVDRYVPQIDVNGRGPVDQEVAEVQNVAMTQGTKVSVLPNDHHIIHVLAHLPSLTNDLDQLESGQGSQQILSAAQLKAQHVADHMHLLKPDKLTEKIIAELQRQFNNAAERTKAATTHAQRAMAKQQQADAQELAARRASPQGASPDAAQKAATAELERQQMKESHDLKMRLTTEEANQRNAIRDAEAAQKLRSLNDRDRVANTVPLTPARTPPIPAPVPEPMAPPAPVGAIPTAPPGLPPVPGM
jgi:hypothetical protein